MNGEKIRILSDHFDADSFNLYAPHPYQSWRYGKAMRTLGYSYMRLGEFHGDNLAKVYQIILIPIPHSSFFIGHLPRGNMLSKLAIQTLIAVLKKKRVIFVRIEPYVVKSISSVPSDVHLVLSPRSLTYDYTMQIALNRSEKELLSHCIPKTRYNIRVAQKYGIDIREMTNIKGFRIFMDVLMKTNKRKKFYSRSLSYHSSVFQSLKRTISHIFIAFHKTIPVAAYEILLFNGRAYFSYGGSDIRFRRYMATNLLMWKSLVYAKQHGAYIFDMSETLGPIHTSYHPWAGLTRFASGYGGEFIQLVTNYDLIINQKLYYQYKKLPEVIHQIFGIIMHSQ